MDCRRQRHLADLVQKQRSPVGGLDAPGAALHRAGKCAARVPEEFGFQQRLGNGRAIDGDKRLAAARREPVQRLGHQFLARARRPLDQHRRHARSHQPHAAADLEHAGGIADQFRQPLCGVRAQPRECARPTANGDGLLLARLRLKDNRRRPVRRSRQDQRQEFPAAVTASGRSDAARAWLSAGAAFHAAVSVSWLRRSA